MHIGNGCSTGAALLLRTLREHCHCGHKQQAASKKRGTLKKKKKKRSGDFSKSINAKGKINRLKRHIQLFQNCEMRRGGGESEQEREREEEL